MIDDFVNFMEELVKIEDDFWCNMVNDMMQGLWQSKR